MCRSIAIVCLALLASAAGAKTWDWSGGTDTPVITYDIAPEKSDDPISSDESILLWNGDKFAPVPISTLKNPLNTDLSILSDIAKTAIRTRSRAEGVDLDLLHALVTAESSGRAQAVSPAGAEGLMQLMPGTAARFGVSDSFDVEENVTGGTAYLRFLLDRYDGDVWKAVAAYNAGEGRVDRGVIPAESRAFANRVVALWINALRRRR